MPAAAAPNGTRHKGARKRPSSCWKLEGRDAVVAALVQAAQAGANLDAQDTVGETALHCAAREGHGAVAETRWCKPVRASTCKTQRAYLYGDSSSCTRGGGDNISGSVVMTVEVSGKVPWQLDFSYSRNLRQPATPLVDTSAFQRC